MARNKEGLVAFRVEGALKKSFEKAFESQHQFSSATGFFEDCMRALILAVREKKELEVPLGFLDRGNPDR